MTEQKSTQTRLIRLGQILRVFMEKDRISTTWLSEYFQTTPRTIQRDLLLLKESGFPLHEIHKGLYELNKDLVKNLEIFDDTELSLVVALKGLVGQLGEPFKKAADGVLDHLYDCITTMPVFVRIDDPVTLDSHLLGHIVKAIQEKKIVFFQYTSGSAIHSVSLEPYKVVYFGGFWYLVGNDAAAKTLKRYALDKIVELKLTKASFKAIPANLDSVLQSSSTIWFSETKALEVVVEVDAETRDYFKRRKMFPTQEIIEEKADGSIIVSYKVGYYEAIKNMLKSWIPHVIILEPEELKKSLIEDAQKWILKHVNKPD
jgi:predicted DNA-binding transcriptional regulator YafY